MRKTDGTTNHSSGWFAATVDFYRSVDEINYGRDNKGIS